MDNYGSRFNNKANIKWESTYTIRAAYALTYRYGRPGPHAMRVNGTNVEWDMSTQAGPEQIETVSTSLFFAPHAKDITNIIQIIDDTLIVDFPPQPHDGNVGWWGVYVIILYESPDITQKICNRIYIADQSQIELQSYQMEYPVHLADTPILFAIHSSRLTGVDDDESRIVINDHVVGEINGADSVTPMQSSGVQGHFYYENGVAEGLNGDVANNKVEGQDGIAVINEYLIANSVQQNIKLFRVMPSQHGGFNPHPSFNITYTPTCLIPSAEMERTYSFCYEQSVPRGHTDVSDTTSLSAIPNYDHYAWTPGKGLSDSTIANPRCFADSSRWYRVRMWNDNDGEACAQTIPVFVTVNQVPRPGNLEIKPSICPANTGKIVFKDMAGKSPFRYLVNGVQRTSNTFEDLEPGVYDLQVKDAAGCSWDSTVVIPLNPVQTAAFKANPESGYSPLRVGLINESKLATDYTWLIDGVPFSNSTHTAYTFADTGTYEVALIAHRLDELCADTAYAYIFVAQGLKLIIPNIITPNNDGRNDALVVQTGGVATMRWEVFNRWGNLLHKGAANRPPVELTLWSPQPNEYPDGVYTLVITAEGESGEVKDFVVQVTVVNYLR